MQNSVVPISDFHLALSVLLVMIVGVISAFLKLGLLKSLVWGTVRTFVQLLVIGYALLWIFRIDSALMVGLILLAMVSFAVKIVLGRVPNAKNCSIPLIFLSLAASTFIVTLMVTGLIISAEKWYTARVVIPIAGMVLGNSMNGIALGLDRLHAEIRNNSAEIETLLSLGATPWEAVQSRVREALRAGMTPSVNSMMAVGVVFIPGMMSGQILGGVDPQTAVRYQIVVMLMVGAAAAIGCLILLLLSYPRCFNREGALRSEMYSRGGHL